jgi:hypothetical protein
LALLLNGIASETFLQSTFRSYGSEQRGQLQRHKLQLSAAMNISIRAASSGNKANPKQNQQVGPQVLQTANTKVNITSVGHSDMPYSTL